MMQPPTTVTSRVATMGLLRAVSEPWRNAPWWGGTNLGGQRAWSTARLLQSSRRQMGLGRTTRGDAPNDGVQGRALQPPDDKSFWGWSASPASQRRGISPKKESRHRGWAGLAVARWRWQARLYLGGARILGVPIMAQRWQNSRAANGQIFLLGPPATQGMNHSRGRIGAT
jgi:hypothetical protein